MIEYISAILDWVKVAISLREKEQTIFFKEGDIWWCNIGMNVGVEAFGKGQNFTRPILILRKINKESFLGAPLTTKLRSGEWYVPVMSGGKEARIALDQIRVLDSKRLNKRIEALNDNDLRRAREALVRLYGPPEIVIPSTPEETTGIGG